jgi:hypothetical protein
MSFFGKKYLIQRDSEEGSFGYLRQKLEDSTLSFLFLPEVGGPFKFARISSQEQ